MILDDRKRAIILGMAEHNMSMDAVAKAQYCHRNSVLYHIHKIKEITGLNPRRFYDLIELVNMAKEDT